MYYKTIFFFSDWCFSCIWQSFKFQEEYFGKNKKELIVTTDDKIRDEKLQYNINREVAKISAFSPGKINKYEYLTGKEIFTPGQKRVIGQD